MVGMQSKGALWVVAVLLVLFFAPSFLQAGVSAAPVPQEAEQKKDCDKKKECNEKNESTKKLELGVDFGVILGAGNSNYQILSVGLDGELKNDNEYYIVKGDGLFKVDDNVKKSDRFEIEFSREQYVAWRRPAGGSGLFYGLGLTYNRDFKAGYDFRIGGGGSLGYKLICPNMSCKFAGRFVFTQDNFSEEIEEDGNSWTELTQSKTSAFVPVFEFKGSFLCDKLIPSVSIKGELLKWSEVVGEIPDKKDKYAQAIVALENKLTNTIGFKIKYRYDYYTNPPMRNKLRKYDHTLSATITIHLSDSLFGGGDQ